MARQAPGRLLAGVRTGGRARLRLARGRSSSGSGQSTSCSFAPRPRFPSTSRRSRIAAGARVVDLSGGFRLASRGLSEVVRLRARQPGPAGRGRLFHARGDRRRRSSCAPPSWCRTRAATPRRRRSRCCRCCAPASSSPIPSSSTPRAAPRAAGARRPRTGRSARSPTTFARIEFCATSTSRRSSARWPWEARPARKVTFTPHLLPVRRGILAAAYGRLRDGIADPAAAVERALADFARDKPFVRVVPPDAGALAGRGGHQPGGAGRDRRARTRSVVVSLAAIDNLVKGAAGQAVQNANLMFGLPETTGLLALQDTAMTEPTAPLPSESLAQRRDLVVEALKYIQKFAGTRAVIKYGGAAMVQPELKRSFAQDVVLLQAAGLRAGHRSRRRPGDHAHPGAAGAEERVHRRPARDRHGRDGRGRDGADRQGEHRDRRASSTRWAARPWACRARTRT